MLLSHGWLATLSKPATISEDDEEELERDMGGLDLGSSGTEDKEVAEWVMAALERKRNGAMRSPETPALHKAPLDAGKGVGGV